MCAAPLISRTWMATVLQNCLWLLTVPLRGAGKQDFADLSKAVGMCSCAHSTTCHLSICCRTENIFKQLDERSLTEEEEHIIQQRVSPPWAAAFTCSTARSGLLSTTPQQANALACSMPQPSKQQQCCCTGASASGGSAAPAAAGV